MALWRVDFEVFGRVQGVWFRRYTVEKAKELGIKGWCMNTQMDTVKGVAEGPGEKLDVFKRWLKYEGSPQSAVIGATFQNEHEIEAYQFNTFVQR